MPKREPYTCSVCKKVHIGGNCWSTDSDEEIDSSLLQAMRALVPKEVPETVEVPRRELQEQSVSSMQSWERGESSSTHEERIPTPSIHCKATSSLSNQKQENKLLSINACVPDADPFRQQTLNVDNVRSHGRIDSGTQEGRLSDEYHMPSPRNYRFSQISALPQPLRVPDLQTQRQQDGQHRRSDEDEQPHRNGQRQLDIQPRRREEHERGHHERRNEGNQQRREVQYPARASAEIPRPLGKLQQAYMKAKEEEDAYKAAHRDCDNKRHHGSSRRREKDSTHRTHQHRQPEPPRHHSSTTNRQNKTIAEKATSTASTQNEHASNQRGREKGK
ncbi:hypothetical protein E6O75_ATG08936 [Venturia nashicola]|uniref:Uncharacterized protein n=1 Tax=Venturia nashicola TaxID=86259 RepID=A0A4Z1P2N9_9PEZI|nr:hypothetical protein E6O75_ATG08936 [Venturia nashicola]